MIVSGVDYAVQMQLLLPPDHKVWRGVNLWKEENKKCEVTKTLNLMRS